MLGRQLELIKLDARKRPLSQYSIFVCFCGKYLFLNLENTFLFRQYLFNVIERVGSQQIQWYYWMIQNTKGNPRLNTSLTKNVMWLSKVEKKWASDQIWYKWHKKHTRKRPLIEHIPQNFEAFLVLPAGCPSCLTTFKGVWVKNTTDCLGWERRLLERESC